MTMERDLTFCALWLKRAVSSLISLGSETLFLFKLKWTWFIGSSLIEVPIRTPLINYAICPFYRLSLARVRFRLRSYIVLMNCTTSEMFRLF